MRLYLGILLAVVVLDQLTKYWLVSVLNLYEMREIIPGLFNLVHVTNKGAAFSMFASVDSPLRHYFFVLVNIAAVIGLTIAAYRTRALHVGYVVSFSLVAGGALGNLIDRLRIGAVTDFLDFYIGSYHWPAFNVADSAICVGVGVLFFVNIVETRKKDNGRNP